MLPEKEKLPFPLHSQKKGQRDYFAITLASLK